MDALQELEAIARSVESLGAEVKALRREIASSKEHAQCTDEEDQDLHPSLVAMAAFLSFSPQLKEDSLLNTVLKCAMQVTQSGGAGLTLYDHERRKLVFQAAIGDGAEDIIGYEVPLEGSRHGLAFVTGEIQAATPLHALVELEVNKHVPAEQKVRFRNVMVAPLLVDGKGVGTMSVVNKQDQDHFTNEDMAAYKHFADLAAQVVRQRLHEETLKRFLKGELESLPGVLSALRCRPNDAQLLGIAEDIGRLAKTRGDLLPLFRQLTGLMVQIAQRLDWNW